MREPKELNVEKLKVEIEKKWDVGLKINNFPNDENEFILTKTGKLAEGHQAAPKVFVDERGNSYVVKRREIFEDGDETQILANPPDEDLQKMDFFLGFFTKPSSKNPEIIRTFTIEKYLGKDLFEYIEKNSDQVKIPVTAEQLNLLNEKLTLAKKLIVKFKYLTLKIYHGDLSPENVIVDPLTKQVYFIDYEHSFFYDKEKKPRIQRYGNIEYGSPVGLIHKARNIDIPTEELILLDIYAFGLLLTRLFDLDKHVLTQDLIRDILKNNEYKDLNDEEKENIVNSIPEKKKSKPEKQMSYVVDKGKVVFPTAEINQKFINLVSNLTSTDKMTQAIALNNALRVIEEIDQSIKTALASISIPSSLHNSSTFSDDNVSESDTDIEIRKNNRELQNLIFTVSFIKQISDSKAEANGNNSDPVHSEISTKCSSLLIQILGKDIDLIRESFYKLIKTVEEKIVVYTPKTTFRKNTVDTVKSINKALPLKLSFIDSNNLTTLGTLKKIQGEITSFLAESTIIKREDQNKHDENQPEENCGIKNSCG